MTLRRLVARVSGPRTRGSAILAGRGENPHGLRGTEPSAIEAQRHGENLRFSDFRHGLLAVLIVVSGATTAGAQVLYGSIVGNVTDSTGGALPGAAVTITHEETRRTRETVTNAEGNYTFTAVQTGTYTVGMTLQGFKAFTRPGVMVTLNTVARVDAALQVGALAETVTVSAASPALQTD